VGLRSCLGQAPSLGALATNGPNQELMDHHSLFCDRSAAPSVLTSKVQSGSPFWHALMAYEFAFYYLLYFVLCCGLYLGSGSTEISSEDFLMKFSSSEFSFSLFYSFLKATGGSC
jgi:hypothetical protein